MNVHPSRPEGAAAAHPERTHYDVLELPSDARPHQVRAQGRVLRSLYEDELGTYGLLAAAEREHQLAEVQKALAVLDDPERRREYDRMLRSQGHPGPWYEPADDSGSFATEVVAPGGGPPPPPLDPEPPAEPPVLEPGERMTGHWLRAMREHRRIDLEDLSQRLKITVTQLENIEAHRFDRLPDPVYLKGFLRSYARATGIDPDRLVDDFLALRAQWVDTA